MLFCRSPKKDLKVLKDLKALLRFIALKDRKVVKGRGRKIRFQKQGFQIVGLPKIGKICLDCGSCQSMVTSCQ